MCGIVGTVSRAPGTIHPEAVRRMSGLIRHRGPDDDGHYIGARAALGMRRLSIIDLSAGQQPITNEDRTVWLVFNGEIYNYRELRRMLQARGHRLVTESDTECIVHLYEDHGDECVSHLRGMFAFALWDERRQRLLLARDRLGIKPLYYCETPDGLAFASELKALLSLDAPPRAIDLEGLAAFLTYGYVPHPKTIYRGMAELPPAHVAAWSDGALRLRRYWSVQPAPQSGKPVEHFAEGLLHELREAVRLHLVSDVPLGAFLSGGIDSSAIVALMTDAADGPVKTFTVGFAPEEPAFDERRFAREVAARFATEHAECVLQPNVREVLPAIVRAFDEPFADSSAIPNFLICGAAREWVTVALSGLGGDELFGGYERYRGGLLAGHYRRLPSLLRRGVIDPLVHAVPVSGDGRSWITRLQRFVEGADHDLPERYQRYIAMYGDAEQQRLLSPDLVAELSRRGLHRTPPAMDRAPSHAHPLNRMLWTDLETYLPDDELRKTDRISMAHSLEVRVPFLDHKVVEFAATIPPEYKIRGWQKKHVLVRAVHDLVPARVLTRRKQGFSIPLGAWLRGPLRDLMHGYLTGPALPAVGLFNPAAITQLVQEHATGRRNHETRIWALLSFMLWHETYMGAAAPVREAAEATAAR